MTTKRAKWSEEARNEAKREMTNKQKFLFDDLLDTQESTTKFWFDVMDLRREWQTELDKTTPDNASVYQELIDSKYKTLITELTIKVCADALMMAHLRNLPCIKTVKTTD